MRFAHVASRAFGRPLLLEPRRGLPFLRALASEIQMRELAGQAPGMQAMDAFDDDGGEPRIQSASLPVGLVERGRKAFPQVGNVAVLEVTGSLVNRLGSVSPYCGMTGYDGLRTQLISAVQDDAVKAIAAYVDCPGGEVTGCFDLADQFREAAEHKPVWAIVDGCCCSAAYALMHAATRITTSASGYVGSIGVIVGHCDLSRMLEKEGIKVSLIYAGAHKADGNEYEPLPEAVRAEFQAEIDAVYDQFVSLVVCGKRLDDKSIRGMESRAYLGADAVRLKLADVVQSPSNALAELIQSVS
jgi:signal peptide peptidase SppA